MDAGSSQQAVAICSNGFLEWLTAVGTVAAAAVAAWLGVREILIRKKEADARMAFAGTALWPEFRRYLAAIERLEQSDPSLHAPVRELVVRITVEPWVRDLVRDLSGPDLDAASIALAHLHHACRHIRELESGTSFPQGNQRKVHAARKSLKEARARIVPLINKWRV